MDKKNIKDLLKKTFVSEADTPPGLAIAKQMRNKSGKVNKDGLKDVNKKVADFEKGVKKDANNAEMPQNKFNYADDFQKDYHDQMEILNGMEMVKYDSIPEEQFVNRALEGIEGSSEMGNNPDWANVVPKQQGFSGPEFGKELVRRIKNSVKLRGEETPAVDLRGKDIQELPTKMRGDNGSKPTAYTKGVIPGKNLKESTEINQNNKPKQIKESMKRLTFKNEFKGLGNALKLIPEGYKVDTKEFEMTDGNETYRFRWEGNLSEGKAVVLMASDKNLVTEDITRMRQLFDYKSQDTLGLVKGNARIDENRIFNDIWAKTKNLMEGEDIENSKADEKPWEKEKKSSSEASAHVQGSVAKDKKTEAPKPKEGEWEETTKKAPEATAHVSSGKGTTLGAKPKEGNWEDVSGGEKMMEIEAPQPKEGEWEQISVPQAPEAKAHVEGSVSTDKGTQAPKPKEGEWDQISVPQAADAKKHITMKENEEEEEVMAEEGFDIMNEEPMEEDVDKLMETMMSDEAEEEKTEE